MQQQKPLSDKERADLAEIRRNRAIKSARREIDNAHHWDGAGKAIVVIIGGGIVLLWPEAVWHKPMSPGGHYTLTTTGWIVQIVWVAILATIGLLIWANKRRA